jgi:hypothetical protein
MKAETSIARRQLVNGLANKGEISKKSERAHEARIIGVGLIGPETTLSKVVDVDQVRTGSFREPVLSHGVAQQCAGVQPPEFPQRSLQ